MAVLVQETARLLSFGGMVGAATCEVCLRSSYEDPRRPKSSVYSKNYADVFKIFQNHHVSAPFKRFFEHLKVLPKVRNPFTQDANEIYGEVVPGRGETLVGNYPGRALSFRARRGESPVVTSFLSKSTWLRTQARMRPLRPFKALQVGSCLFK